MSISDSKIIYTITDEAPALATQSFLHIVEGAKHSSFMCQPHAGG